MALGCVDRSRVVGGRSLTIGWNAWLRRGSDWVDEVGAACSAVLVTTSHIGIVDWSLSVLTTCEIS